MRPANWLRGLLGFARKARPKQSLVPRGHVRRWSIITRRCFPTTKVGAGEHVIAERMTLKGQRIDPEKNYRVTVNNYLAVGGDGFSILKDGTAQRFGIYDSDALYAYFQGNSPIGPAAANRIARLN